ncbi:MAG: DUF6503 family protein [Bacteroidota bacterium]
MIALFAGFLATGCQQKTSPVTEETPLDSQQIVDRAIEAHGGGAYQGQQIAFDFRDKYYEAILGGGRFSYLRQFETEEGRISDRLDNQGFTRYLGDEILPLADSLADRYASSVNSVIYFALLPYFLNDAAANKSLLGYSILDSTDYYLIKVTFDEEGGGKDFEDEFLYWVHPETFLIDHLAYGYAVNGGGLRFRKGYNPRVVGGIRFLDYINYQADHHRFGLTQLDSLYQAGGLTELSRIELMEITVTPSSAAAD